MMHLSFTHARQRSWRAPKTCVAPVRSRSAKLLLWSFVITRSCSPTAVLARYTPSCKSVEQVSLCVSAGNLFWMTTMRQGFGAAGYVAIGGQLPVFSRFSKGQVLFGPGLRAFFFA